MGKLLRDKEVCRRLKVSSITLYRWRKQGMPHIKAGKQIRYDINSILNWF